MSDYQPPTDEQFEFAEHLVEEIEAGSYEALNVADLLAKREPRWIPTAERLPEPNSGYVLGFMANGRYWITWLNEEGRWRGTDPNFPPTHWMPLPAPPH